MTPDRVCAVPLPPAAASPVPRNRKPVRDAGQPVGVLELYRHMWHYAAGVRGRLVLAALMLVASQLLKLLVPLCAAKAIEALQRAQDGHGLAGCLPWIGGIVGVSAAVWTLHGPGRVIERSVAVHVRRNLADRLYRRVSRAPLAWHDAHHSAELAHRMSQSSLALWSFTQSQFIYLQSAVNVVGPLVALSMLSVPTSALALAGMGLEALTIVAFDRALMRLARTENAAERRRSAALLDCLSSISTVLSLRLQETTRRLLRRRLDDCVAPLSRSITLNEWKWCAVDLMGVVLAWTLVVLYAWRAEATGAALLGTVFMVHQYAQQACGVIGSLAANLQNFARMRTDFASADPVWEAPQRAAAQPLPRSMTGWRTIDLVHLHFEHRPQPTAPATPPPTSVGDRRSRVAGRRATDVAPAMADATLSTDGATAGPQRRGGLHDVSLRLHAGERIALVGPSGCGKSTLLRLLAGLYAPTHGHVEFDGVAHLNVRGLGPCATLIPQEAQLFEASVRENLAFDLPYDDGQILDAAHTGSFDDVLRSLPQGLDTPVSQGGANLSGGQRQRLCLARGLLAARGSSVLLLDEPTSALDPLTEQKVLSRIGERYPGACIVASVHRMSLLEQFDRVVLMADGTVVDSGTVDELLMRQPMFRRMVGGETGSAPTTPPAMAR